MANPFETTLSKCGKVPIEIKWGPLHKQSSSSVFTWYCFFRIKREAPVCRRHSGIQRETEQDSLSPTDLSAEGEEDGQELRGPVEDVDEVERDEGRLRVQVVVRGHQHVNREHRQRDLQQDTRQQKVNKKQCGDTLGATSP